MPVIGADTAGSAREIAEAKGRGARAIASRLAAELYGLDILAENIEDESHNTTRFVILSARGMGAGGEWSGGDIFRLPGAQVPAALYKALGGFATNGVNMTSSSPIRWTAPSPPRNSMRMWTGHPDDTG